MVTVMDQINSVENFPMCSILKMLLLYICWNGNALICFESCIVLNIFVKFSGVWIIERQNCCQQKFQGVFIRGRDKVVTYKKSLNIQRSSSAGTESCRRKKVVYILLIDWKSLPLIRGRAQLSPTENFSISNDFHERERQSHRGKKVS